MLVGVAAWSDPSSRPLAALALAGGAGLVAIAVGIASGGMESPLASVGFVAAFIGTLGFYGLIGRQPNREYALTSGRSARDRGAVEMIAVRGG